MKKTIGILLIAVLVILGGAFTVSAEDNAVEEQKIFKINIDNICTLLWAGEKPEFSVELDPEALEKIDVVSEKWIGPNELTVSGDNIAVEGGKYRYELKLSAKEGFVFNNDLEINYQGIDGKYKLHYDFPPGEDTNHTMIVTGDFDNIIAASPLIDKIDIGKLLTLMISEDYAQAVDFILDDGVSLADKAYVDSDSSKINHVSDDKYSYELVLKTKEGFSFKNNLQFLYDEDKYGYALDYDYNLSEDRHTLIIKGNAEKAGLKPGTGAKAADKAVTGLKKDSDPAGTAYAKLQVKSAKQTDKSITLSWAKAGKATKYVIYGNKSGDSSAPKKLATVSGNTKTFSKIAGRNLKKGTYYKFIIVALDKNNKVVSASRMIYVTVKGGNYRSVTVSKSVIAKAKKLKKGKTLKLNARAVAQSKKLKVKKHAGLRYATSNKKIATVSKSGRITAKKKGTCYIYAYAQNGVCRKIKVKVK
ncbi:MAG: fibronectin type III domain-containing protein [Mogibacterium sp.]|nr:fibronectin type III domain-containing protein [Mogibacterium sp.]